MTRDEAVHLADKAMAENTFRRGLGYSTSTDPISFSYSQAMTPTVDGSVLVDVLAALGAISLDGGQKPSQTRQWSMEEAITDILKSGPCNTTLLLPRLPGYGVTSTFTIDGYNAVIGGLVDMERAGKIANTTNGWVLKTPGTPEIRAAVLDAIKSERDGAYDIDILDNLRTKWPETTAAEFYSVMKAMEADGLIVQSAKDGRWRVTENGRQSAEMPLHEAIEVVVSAHTFDDRIDGFSVWGTAKWPACGTPEHAHFRSAWKTLRRAANRPVEPGDYPKEG